MREIRLFRVGKIDLALAGFLGAAIGERLGLNCFLSDKTIDAESAYSPLRRQYNSTHLLSKLAQHGSGGEVKLLGIADVDLYMPVLTFVFGEAQLGNNAAIVSVYRLRQSFYGLPEDEVLFYERCEKEALHELGHTFGLIHCADFSCVMHFSNSVENIDMKGSDFCQKCRLEARLWLCNK